MSVLAQNLLDMNPCPRGEPPKDDGRWVMVVLAVACAVLATMALGAGR